MKRVFIYGTPDFSAIEKAARASQNEDTRNTSLELVGQRHKFRPNSSMTSSEKRQRQIRLVYLGPAKKQKKSNAEPAIMKTVKISVIKKCPSVLQKWPTESFTKLMKWLRRLKVTSFQWIIKKLKVNKISEYMLKSEYWTLKSKGLIPRSFRKLQRDWWWWPSSVGAQTELKWPRVMSCVNNLG